MKKILACLITFLLVELLALSYLKSPSSPISITNRLFAELGNVEAQKFLGNAYFKGEDVEKDEATGVMWYEKAATQGDIYSQLMMGAAYQFGVGVLENKDKSVEWYQKSAEQGNEIAQFQLGAVYLIKHTISNGKYQMAKADYMLGRSLYEPVNDPEINKYAIESIKWFRQAAKQGNAEAQLQLGDFYIKGDVVPEDAIEASNWYRKSAEQGNAEAQLKLADSYINGKGIPRDVAESMKWYRKASEQENAMAQMQIGYAYFFGNSLVDEDKAEAVRWFIKVAENKNSNESLVRESQNHIAQSYAKGEGVTKDIIISYMWSNLSSSFSQSSEESIKLRNDLEKKMTKEQIIEGQRLAREWQEKYKKPL